MVLLQSRGPLAPLGCSSPSSPRQGQTRPKGTGQPLGPRRLRQQMAEEMGGKRPKDQKRKVVLQRTGAEGSPPKRLRHPGAGPRRAQARFPAGPALAQHVLQEGMHPHRSGGRRVGLGGLRCPQTLLGPSEARGSGQDAQLCKERLPSGQERELRFWLGPPWACPALIFLTPRQALPWLGRVQCELPVRPPHLALRHRLVQTAQPLSPASALATPGPQRRVRGGGCVFGAKERGPREGRGLCGLPLGPGGQHEGGTVPGSLAQPSRARVCGQ